MTRRIVIVSDLHLGGAAPSMMSSPSQLARFIRELEETVELVVAGDFVDFLAVPPLAAWTPDPEAAVTKLTGVMDREPFGVVFDALADHSGPVTVIVGNHDVELALPAVQDALAKRIAGRSAKRVSFVDDNRAYRAGGLLVEHGNRYDGANENDWSGLRAIASAQSRYEPPRDNLEVSAGSVLVEKLVSPLKSAGCSFVDLLQPQGELLALLMVAFEPALVLELPKIRRVLRANRLQQKNSSGFQPGETRHVAFAPSEPPDNELVSAFGDIYLELLRYDEDVGLGDLMLTAWQARRDSIGEILKRGDEIPADRLRQIRAAMRKLVHGSGLQLEEPDRQSDTEQYGLAAARIIDAAHGRVEAVVMGHTHLAKHVGPTERASYVNTGTWADVIRVPRIAIEGQLSDLYQFLRDLHYGKLRRCPATYCSVTLDDGGSVASCKLGEVPRDWWPS